MENDDVYYIVYITVVVVFFTVQCTFELRALNLVCYVVQTNERKYDLNERINKRKKNRSTYRHMLEIS